MPSLTEKADLAELQKRFAAHVFAAVPVPKSLCSQLADSPGWPAVDRLSVHRNTTLLTLIEALEVLFPVVARLVGGAFFSQAARCFITAQPPTCPVLSLYGAEFPDFLERLPQASSVPYIADVARLERAWSHAQQADDDPPLDRTGLADLALKAQDDGVPLRLALHGSASLLASAWPVVSIWQANQQQDPPEILANHGEYAVISRPWGVVVVDHIDPLSYCLLNLIVEGFDLDQIMQNLLEQDPACDLGAVLNGLLLRGVLAPAKGE